MCLANLSASLTHFILHHDNSIKIREGELGFSSSARFSASSHVVQIKRLCSTYQKRSHLSFTAIFIAFISLICGNYMDSRTSDSDCSFFVRSSVSLSPSENLLACSITVHKISPFCWTDTFSRPKIFWKITEGLTKEVLLYFLLSCSYAKPMLSY